MLTVVVRAALGLGALAVMQGVAWADTTAENQPAGATAAPSPSPTLIAQVPPSPPPPGGPAIAAPAAAPAPCTGPVDPYKNYACLDAYLGDDVLTRLFNYYRLEWGESGPPTDPNAPPGRRADWPRTPETTPPMPFTEWPYGGTQNLGVTRPSSADSPLMAAIANTSVGQWMNDNHLQLYGWIDPGLNISSNSVRPGGNAPVAYSYTPNTVQLDQAVLYFERVPDTVQNDHVDWGFRISGLYGENYRYTTAFGLGSHQLLNQNSVNGYDFPMVYGEVFIPQAAPAGLLIRVGRFISLPDIEAQLAPNNYMYSHSLTYGFDNYTNTGIQTTWGLTKDLFLQVGLTGGTESVPWHLGVTRANPDPNPLYPGTRMPVDPGAQPSGTLCFRYNWNDGWDNINGCADSINDGSWGYNNLQWYGFTAYHKWNDQWHISFEAYDEHQNHVLNADNPQAAGILAAGGTPFSPQYMPFNAPNPAHCGANRGLSCYAHATGVVFYLNYSPDPLDNFSLRPEFYGDWQGQRTGTKARYVELSLGWQHWLSPQIEFRPEVGYYRSIGGLAFNGDSNAGIPGNKNYTWIAQSDMIFHF